MQIETSASVSLEHCKYHEREKNGDPRSEIPNTVVERPVYGGPKVKITGIVAPGILTEREKVSFSTKTELLTEISSWLGRIRDDLLAVPPNRGFAESQGQVEELTKQVGDLLDEYYSREEADDLRRRRLKLHTSVQSAIGSDSVSHANDWSGEGAESPNRRPADIEPESGVGRPRRHGGKVPRAGGTSGSAASTLARGSAGASGSASARRARLSVPAALRPPASVSAAPAGQRLFAAAPHAIP